MTAVRKVDTKADFDTFLKFPWALYKDDPNWVPPLLSMQRHKLDRTKNSSWKHMEGEYFIAWRGEKPVGTIAAFINHRHNEFWDERIGFFGCFEVYDDQEAANALLDTASRYVEGCGCASIRGPATFSTNEECGILIEGFDEPPVVLYSYNYPYYPRLMENAPGFEKAMDLHAYYLTLAGARTGGAVEKTTRITRKNNERRGITVRGPDTKHLKQEFAALRTIYNAAWEKNWGFVPLTDEELDELVKDLGTYFEPDLTYFAEVDGQPVGFLLGVPDMFQALHPAYPRPGKPEIVTLARTLWHWKIRPSITRIRIPLMGVKDGYRGIGIEAAMFAALYEKAIRLAPRRGWVYADGGWVLETNEPMRRLCAMYDGRVYKRFRIYERTLAPE